MLSKLTVRVMVEEAGIDNDLVNTVVDRVFDDSTVFTHEDAKVMIDSIVKEMK